MFKTNYIIPYKNEKCTALGCWECDSLRIYSPNVLVCILSILLNWVWWYTSITPAFWMSYHKFKDIHNYISSKRLAILGYIKLCQKLVQLFLCNLVVCFQIQCLLFFTPKKRNCSYRFLQHTSQALYFLFFSLTNIHITFDVLCHRAYMVLFFTSAVN